MQTKSPFEYRMILLLIVVAGVGLTGGQVENIGDFLLGIGAAFISVALLLLINELLPARERFHLITAAKLRELRAKANKTNA